MSAPTGETQTPLDWRFVGKRIDDAVSRPAKRLLGQYFDVGHGFAAYTFDTYGLNDPHAINEDDLVAASLLDISFGAISVRRLLDDRYRRSVVSGILDRVSTDVDLWAAGTELDAADELWRILVSVEYPDIGSVKAGKLLARKRPRLIPIIDRTTVAQLGELGAEYWVILRSCLQDNDRIAKIESLRPRWIPESVSTLRLLDVAVWMKLSESRRAKRARRHAERPDEYGVYVIELAPGAGESPVPSLPPLYVGQSVRTPEERFAQHRRGYKPSRHVKRHGQRLRPDLYGSLPRYEHQERAEQAEKDLAAHYRNVGHLVFGGT